MISVCIWGMPELPEEQLVELINFIHHHLRPLVDTFTGNQPSGETICVYFQKDLMRWELGMEVLIEIKGCHHDLAQAHRENIAAVVNMVKSLISNCKYVECRVLPRVDDIVVHA